MMLLNPTPAAQQKTFICAKMDTIATSFWLSRQKELTNRLYVVVCESQVVVDNLAAELQFFGINTHIFADWETLAYDRLSVQDDIISERIRLLSHMPTTGVLLVAVQTLMQRLAPPSWLLGQHFDVAVGERFDRAYERDRLIKAGYRLVDTVYSVGEFAIRGAIIDVFAMGQLLPFRLELFDDDIEKIRLFDPSTQRTLNPNEISEKQNSDKQNTKTLAGFVLEQGEIVRFSVLPAKEFDSDGGKSLFRQNFAKLFPETSHRKSELYQDVMAGILPLGIQYYQPLFFDESLWQTGTLFAYLPDNAVFVVSEDLFDWHAKAWQAIDERYQNHRHDKDNPIVPPPLLFLPSNEFFAQLKPFATLVLGEKGDKPITHAVIADGDLRIDHQSDNPLKNLREFMATCREPILLVAESAGRREVLLDLLGSLSVQLFADFEQFFDQIDLSLVKSAKNDKNQTKPNKAHLNQVNTKNQPPIIGLTVAPIERGLHIADQFCLISEAQIFGRQTQKNRRKTSALSQAFLIKSVSEMNEGSLVVHIEHGIGRFCGLVLLDVGDGEQEFIHLKYADDASVYVPITNLALIGRYSGTDSEAVALSKIGSGKWDKARQKTLTQIYDVAAELLNVQARRRANTGIAFAFDKQAYELFASGFEYELTDDQTVAINAVLDDMRQNKPMDRLICGDVGFGKTEVAMRAAFMAVQAGYQVAVLVPTTLLAGQHEDNFKNRFADWAIRIESLSRFGSQSAQNKTLQALAEGKVDIVIGTHKLLQSDVVFHRLGLMIIDEEHRFGVRHKERIKAMQANIDSLSMTATPIPRTLNMALSGLQDICIIATPPARRLAIKTFVAEKSDQTMIDAIMREILRGGQVYYLHNDVASINAEAERLTTLMPEVRVAVAHGQMHERELSAVMSGFYHKKTNVLVATTIIETGIDIPNANTIIINRADKFGLAQLHQLRGRVGRSHHQAYCYLFVPSVKGLSVDAKKRLDAISRANMLGAGFMLASEDLEIRGAGELLGKEQSGNMQTIGFGLYMDMLARATKAIKAGTTPKLDSPLDLVSDINMHTSALIPSDYLGDVHERLLFYKRIANTDHNDELLAIRTEMIDRFGAMPTPMVHLFLVHRLRILAHQLGISKIDVSDSQLTLAFRPDTPIDGRTIVALIQSDDNYRMLGATGLRYYFKQTKTADERFDTAFALLDYLAKSII